ncbi:MAG: hypothetical protein Ctma_0074 [Catillopecten margaritatus gill symbiont]|uniref:DUF883 domain-containing protein n=1 Tax=Catillopecten margaritatus gill symbiont TaxID=3083288 RepID=A0AAU6PEG0_9GAMM
MKKLEKLEVDIAEVMAATRKLGAETTKLNTEIFWYPMALATGLVLAVGAVVKYLL